MGARRHDALSWVVVALATASTGCGGTREDPSGGGTPGESAPAAEETGTPQARAEQFARAFLTRQQAGGFAALGEEATPEMRAALTAEKQRAAWEGIRAQFGDYQNIEYVERLRPPQGRSMTVFRFRATFTKGGRPEVRVVLDGRNKVSGLWIRPWSDDLGSPRISRLDDGAVDVARKERATSLAEGLLGERLRGEYRVLGDEATPEMGAALTVERQRSAHEDVKSLFGAYLSLEYAEAWQADDGSTIFRFRGSYTGGKPEVRVVLDKQGLLAGFWIRPWRDGLS